MNEPEVELVMSHIVSTHGGFVTPETTKYLVQKAVVRRPGTAFRYGHLVCQACGKPQRIRVHDIGTTRRRRRRSVLIAAAGALVIAAAVLAVAFFGDEYDAVAPVSGVTIAFAFLTAYMGFLSAVRERGVVIRARDLDTVHAVVPPYNALGWNRHEREKAAPATFVWED